MPFEHIEKRIKWDEVDRLILLEWSAKDIAYAMRVSYPSLLYWVRKKKGFDFRNYKKHIKIKTAGYILHCKLCGADINTSVWENYPLCDICLNQADKIKKKIQGK